MCLKRKVSFYPNGRKDKKEELTITGIGKEIKITPPLLSRIIVEEEVGCWRNSWQIHEWFARHLQEELNSCQEYELSFDTLLELREYCIQVLSKNNLAEELLPTYNTDKNGNMLFDDTYFEELRQTIEMIDEMKKINDKEDGDYYYYSYSAWW